MAVDCEGEGKDRAGGLAMLWKGNVEVSVMSFSQNHIDVKILEVAIEKKWRATGVYGYSENGKKLRTCELIQTLHNESQSPWLLFGDSNLVLCPSEKKGGNPPNHNHVETFRDTLFRCNLVDLNYVGDPFTWANGQGGENRVEAKTRQISCEPSMERVVSRSGSPTLVALQFESYALNSQILAKKEMEEEEDAFDPF